MSVALKEKLLSILYDALYETNEILGYEIIDRKKVEKNKELFLQLLTFGEELLKEKRGVTLEYVETEPIDYEKTKRAALLGLFHGIVLKESAGNTFEEKFKNFLYSSGIEGCEWIDQTSYKAYYQSLFIFVSGIKSDAKKIKFVGAFSNQELPSTIQSITKIRARPRFFKAARRLNEATVDEYLDVFREWRLFLKHFSSCYAV